MAEGYAALTEKEKQTLRLIVRGHDAKSSARQLGLSVHTINDRLRHARRKLSVTSSREAARLVLDREGGGPNSLGDKQMGEVGPVFGMAEVAAPPDGPATNRRLAWPIAGVLIMSLILATLALLPLTQMAEPVSRLTNASESGTAVDSGSASDALRATREWLALIDENNWTATYAATSQQFQEINTLEVWTSVSEKVRRDFGATLSRTLIGQESVPAPPHGLQMVKFSTRFANKGEAVETLTLAHENGAWKVVGYYID